MRKIAVLVFIVANFSLISSGEDMTNRVRFEESVDAYMPDALEYAAASYYVDWQYGMISGNVPPFSHAGVLSFERVGEQCNIILDTDLNGYNSYITILERDSYSILYGGFTAIRGSIQIYFSWNGDNKLEMIVKEYALDPLWPANMVPPFIFPPEGKKIADDINVINATGSVYNMGVEYEGMNRSEAEEYIQTISRSMEKSDYLGYGVNGSVRWNNETWWLYVEIYDVTESMARISYGWGPELK